jgi:hypothetical protein
VRISRLSLRASSIVPSVSTSALPSDKTGNPKERISCFKKGGTPLAHVMTILLFFIQKDINPLKKVDVFLKKRFSGAS